MLAEHWQVIVEVQEIADETGCGVGLVEREYLLATTGRGSGRRDGRQHAMTQDARDHRLMGDGGNDPQ